jgi:hypothetical protein
VVAVFVVQAWQQAQVELVMRQVKGVAGTACEGKTFDITFRWARHTAAPRQAKLIK